MGSAVANRTRRETEGLIGFFVNTLALRTDLTGNPDLTALLERVRQATLEDFAHQDLPFERLVGEVVTERSLSHSPLFQVMLVLQNAATATLELPELTLERLPVSTETVKFDLTLMLAETPAGLDGVWQYRASLFDAPTVARLAASFETLLTAAAERPGARLSELPLLGAAEAHQMALEWNDDRVSCPGGDFVHELFAARAVAAPDSVAVVAAGRVLTYGELGARAGRLAGRLRELGVRPESLVGIYVERSPEMVVGLLAILAAGGAYLPLDPSYPPERLAFMVADAGVTVLLTERRLVPSVPAGAERIVLVDDLPLLPLLPTPAGAIPGSRSAPQLAPDHPAYVIYTSGSTGRPKGVVISHRSLANRLRFHAATDLDRETRLLQKTSISFDVSLLEIFGPLLAGGAMVQAQPGGERDLAYLAHWIAAERVTHATFPPSLLAVLLEDAAFLSCDCLRIVVTGSETVPAELPGRFHARLAAELWNRYGPTECTIAVTAWKCRPGEGERVLPIGRPIARAEIHLLDAGERPVPVGVAGEIAVGGVCLARGYLARPEVTAERFVPDPLPGAAAGARLYRTGDLARHRPDGALEFLGRLDGQVKIRGFRVEIGEVEAALRAMPGIAEVAVVDRLDSTGALCLVAYLVPGPESAPAEADLRAFLGARLPGYMVPAGFVTLPALPLGTSGKVDRRALARLDYQAAAGGETAHVAPRTPAEERVAAIWAEVLAVERVGAVGADSDFFALGGHSLLATRVISRVRQAFGVEVPLRSLFEAPTVAAFARQVELAGGGRQAPPLVPRRRAGAVPLSFAQERLWLIDQLQPGSAAYNMPAALRLRGRLDLAALAATFAELDRRHESLRTTFREADGQPVQEIHPAAPPSPQTLPRVDLAGLPGPRREGEAHRLARDEARRPFDLMAGPLLRLTLLRLGGEPEEHVALLTQHHIVTDGWSIGVLVHELGALYTAFHERRPSPLPEPALQYADFALWQREWLAGGELAAQLGYWRSRLATAPQPPELLALPLDRPRTALPGSRGGSVAQRLPAALVGRLHALGRGSAGSAGGQPAPATLFMVLLAAWSAFLSRISGQEEVVVGSAVANRTRRETEGLIGFFVNTLALRTDLTGDPGFSALLGRVRQKTLADFAHQDLPFERLVGEVVAERSLSHSPLFQVVLVLQNTSNAVLENAATARLELPELTLEGLPVGTETVKFDLTLGLVETPAGLDGVWRYRASLFDAPTVTRLAAAFETLLTAAAERPWARLSELPLLGAAEAHQLALEWNDDRVSYPGGDFVHELFAARGAAAPDSVAVVAAGQVLSYGELGARASRLAGRLRELGVRPESLVGIYVERSPEMVVGLLAILKAGGAYLPLDPAYPRARLAFMLADAGASVVVTQAGLRHLLHDLAEDAGADATGTAGRIVRLDADAEAIAQQPSTAPVLALAPANLAYVIYTSGSTGTPKGVLGSHLGLANRFAAQSRM
ncbi:MAG TPA: amino acid adenylation domain-containing protein, partial [Thermoanaerobaculia bacterium]|nr:amino acid adenylation domain-containing protein [Thermoanaerobaculia bacterium]